MEELFDIHANKNEIFYFQRSLSIGDINNETKALDRKAHLFWEIPAIDKRVCEFMDSILISGMQEEKSS